MTGASVDFAARDGERVRVDSAAISRLAAGIAGTLLRPDDPGWDEATRIWNALAASTPALAVRPVSALDVAEAIRFAREHGVLLSIKGGGHNIAGTAVAARALLLDMSAMRDVRVDAGARIAHVGPGCLLRDVDAATQKHGLATVLGFVSETGVAGLTLGGGFGYLARRFGWAADNLEEVEIVTADARVLIANRSEHADLFWAVRGGGGNFGVVTRFTFRLHRVGPRVTGGLIAWSGDRARDVLDAYHRLTEAAPRELTAAAVVRRAPPAPFFPEAWHGELIAGMLICHSGRNAARDIAAIRELGEPIADLLAERKYVELQSLLDGAEPKGMNYYWKSEFLPGLSSDFLDAFHAGAQRVTSPMSESVIFHIGGALNERSADDGAVGNRDARYVTGFAACWPPGSGHDAEHIAWVQNAWESIRPFSTGGNYVNFQLADDDRTRTRAAYRASYERLCRIKAMYDPGNLFRVNRNIAPGEHPVASHAQHDAGTAVWHSQQNAHAHESRGRRSDP